MTDTPKDTNPFDLLNPNNYDKDKDKVEERLAICRQCTHFRASTEQCRKCGCFMKLKTKLERSHCPIGKW